MDNRSKRNDDIPGDERSLRQRPARHRSSTSRRTDAGKAVSAQNSVTHGLTKREGLLPGEDPVEFESFERKVISGLKPHGPLEEGLAVLIVWLMWKLQYRFPRVEADVVKLLEFRRLEKEHLSRLDQNPSDVEFFTIRSLSDSALAGEARLLAILDNQDPQTRLEHIAKGRSVGTKMGALLQDYLNADAEDPARGIGASRVERQLRRQTMVEAEAARRSALKEETRLGREFLWDIESGSNALDRVHRYQRESTSDLLKLSRELERLQGKRAGEILPAPLTVDVNLSHGGGRER
jgi:hypothetical protein